MWLAANANSGPVAQAANSHPKEVIALLLLVFPPCRAQLIAQQSNVIAHIVQRALLTLAPLIQEHTIQEIAADFLGTKGKIKMKSYPWNPH